MKNMLKEKLAQVREISRPAILKLLDVGADAAVRLAQGYDGVAIGLDATLLIGGVQAQIRACRG